MEPMMITKVEKQKRGTHRYNIFVNEEFAFSVHEDLLVKFRLFKGESIEAEEMAQILAEDEFHKAYVTAIRFLGVRPRSSKEVRMRLKRDGHEPALIDQVLERLGREGYINDEAFAELTTDHRIRLQKKGRLWVKQELQGKGVAKERILEALGKIDPEEEETLAYELADKKWRQSSGDRLTRKRKLQAFLLRRGYPAPMVQRVVRKVSSKAPAEHEEEEQAEDE